MGGFASQAPKEYSCFVFFVRKHGVDYRRIPVCKLAYVLMSEFDNLPEPLVFPYRNIVMFRHMSLNHSDPVRFLSEESAIVFVAFRSVARSASRNKIAEAVFAKGCAIDWNDMLHHQIPRRAAIGAPLTEIGKNCLPLVGVELFVADAAKEVPDKSILGDPDRIASVAPTGRPFFCCNHGSLYLRAEVFRHLPLSKVLAQKGKAIASWWVKPLTGHPNWDPVNFVGSIVKPNMLLR